VLGQGTRAGFICFPLDGSFANAHDELVAVDLDARLARAGLSRYGE
jgi:hypothetical protein